MSILNPLIINLMKSHLPPLHAVLLLLGIASSLHHDYELSRGRKMWMGVQHAIHYFDHFSLLTHRMNNIKGMVTSNYPFHFKDEWSLTFELKKMGQSLNERDGFVMMLSPQNIDAFEMGEENKSTDSFLSTVVS